MTELNLPLEEQLHGFLIAVAAGVLLGALYDAVRVYRILMRPPKRQVFFLDTAVLVLCSFLTFLTALAACSGVLRFYLFLGEGLGWCLYAFTLGKITVRLASAVLWVLERLVFRPARRLAACAKALLIRLFGRVKSFLKKILKQRKKALKPPGKVVYNRSGSSRKVKRKKIPARRDGGELAGHTEP